MEKTKEKKETTQEKKLSLEEKRLLEIRKQINNNNLLDEYTTLYTTMMLSYASTLKINFDNIKE
jgi:hypothetical protein